MRPIRMTRFFMGCLSGFELGGTARRWTSQAGPKARVRTERQESNGREGNPKARSGAAIPNGLHGPRLLGCGQGLALHWFIGERRAAPSVQTASAPANRPRQLRPVPGRKTRHSATANRSPSLHHGMLAPTKSAKVSTRPHQTQSFTRTAAPALSIGCNPGAELAGIPWKAAALECMPQRQRRASPIETSASPRSTPFTETVASVRP